MSKPQLQMVIGVIGGGYCTPEIAGLAEQVGRLIAQRGAILLCGGMAGVMEAACRGAKTQGGFTIGILPGTHKDSANPYVDVALPTGMADARNVIIARSSDAIIAIDGSYGTLSEMAFALKFDVPVVGLKSWTVDPNVIQAATAEQAVELAYTKIKSE